MWILAYCFGYHVKCSCTLLDHLTEGFKRTYVNKSTRWHFSQVKRWKFKYSLVHVLHNSTAELVANQFTRFKKLDVYMNSQNLSYVFSYSH